jgi:hypothetical protein
MELFKEFCKRALRGELTIKFIMELLKELFAKVKSFYPPHRIIGIAVSFALFVVGFIWTLNASYFERQIPNTLAAFGVIGIILFAVPAKVLLKGFVRRSKFAIDNAFGEKAREREKANKEANNTIVGANQEGSSIVAITAAGNRVHVPTGGGSRSLVGFTSKTVTVKQHDGVGNPIMIWNIETGNTSYHH